MHNHLKEDSPQKASPGQGIEDRKTEEKTSTTDSVVDMAEELVKREFISEENFDGSVKAKYSSEEVAKMQAESEAKDVKTERKSTLGERRVRVSFNVSGSSIVDHFKLMGAAAIDTLESLRDKFTDPEYQRLISKAQTETEDATSACVKAVTFS